VHNARLVATDQGQDPVRGIGGHSSRVSAS
jgi:hypothetical protein